MFPAFSPDGNGLLFEREAWLFNCDLFVLGLNSDLSAGGEPRRITYQHAMLGGLAWMPDGRDAIWSHLHAQAERVSIFHPGPADPLPFQDLAYPAVSRRQNRLAYAQWLQDVDIWQANGDKTQRHPVSSTATDGFPLLSPDGKRIVFVSYRSGPQQMWVSNADGTQAFPITSSAKFHSSDFPRWSPDGQWIAFHAEAADGRDDIWIIDANGSRPRRLTNDGLAGAPSFSHDGKWVYFSSLRTGRWEIFRIPLAGGKAIQVTHAGADYGLESPDGRMLYYLKAGELFCAPIAGGKESSLGLHVIQDDFEVMSDGVYYIAQMHGNRFRGGEIRFYDLATRRNRLIQALGDQLFIFGFSVSPDRKTFLYSAEQGTGADLMLVENFR